MIAFFAYFNLLIALLGIAWAIRVTRDPFHPLIFLMPMAIYVYVYKPLALPLGVFESLFTEDELLVGLSIISLSLVALFAGCVSGSSLRRKHLRKSLTVRDVQVSPKELKAIKLTALLFIAIALFLYYVGLSRVGGFWEAYATSKGGYALTGGSGYSRDFIGLVVPGVIMLFISMSNRGLRPFDIFLVALSTLPLLVHGVLSGRRGPTFVMLVTLATAWYLARGKRPGFARIFSWQVMGGFLLLILVAYRGSIHLRGDVFSELLSPNERVTQRIFYESGGRLHGEELIYGLEMIADVREEGDYYFGRRIATHLFVRPIPSTIWPDKYRQIGMESLLFNGGTAGMKVVVSGNPYITPGAASGLMADMFVEFAWLSFGALYLIGFVYGRAWLRATRGEHYWIVVYTILLAHSVYLVSQSMVAILGPVVLTIVPTTLVWKLFIKKRSMKPTYSNMPNNLPRRPFP
jgi:hypothetical protein